MTAATTAEAGGFLARLAPPGPLPARLLYLAVRAAHFLVMVIAIPLAYRAAHAPGAGGTLPGGLLVVAWFSLLFWLMFHFLLHSHAYPARLGEAVAVTTVPLVNLCAGGTDGFARGALTVVLASILALALGFVVLLVLLTVPALRERTLPGAPGYLWKILAGFLPVLLLLLAVFAPPLERITAGGPRLWAGFGLLAQVVSELALLRRSSILDREGSRLDTPRARLAAAWAPFMILCMFAALAGFAGAAFLRG
jgi:hypothetical protein